MKDRQLLKTKAIRQLLRTSSGVTLLEMLVVISIFAFVATALYGTAAVGEGSWQINKTQIELQQELRKAMDWVIFDLRLAGDASIVTPSGGSCNPSITFKTPSGVTGGVLTWNADNIQFALDDETGRLQRTEGEETKVIAQNLQSIQFCRPSGTIETLNVAMQAQKNSVKGVPLSYQLDFSIQLRN